MCRMDTVKTFYYTYYLKMLKSLISLLLTELDRESERKIYNGWM